MTRILRNQYPGLLFYSALVNQMLSSTFCPELRFEILVVLSRHDWVAGIFTVHFQFASHLKLSGESVTYAACKQVVGAYPRKRILETMG